MPLAFTLALGHTWGAMGTTKVVEINIAAQLQWNCFRAKGGHWVGVCDPLKLTVQADTWAELMEDIGQTLDLMLKDLLKSNELERFLRDHGWKMVGGAPSVAGRDVRFDVPFIPALMRPPRGSQRSTH